MIYSYLQRKKVRDIIGCRIWVKIVGDTVLFEANGRVFWKTKLRLS